MTRPAEVRHLSELTVLLQVDVYCYGLVMFELMTEGHKPFEELGTGFEIDKFIAEVRSRGILVLHDVVAMVTLMSRVANVKSQ